MTHAQDEKTRELIAMWRDIGEACGTKCDICRGRSLCADELEEALAALAALASPQGAEQRQEATLPVEIRGRHYEVPIGVQVHITALREQVAGCHAPVFSELRGWMEHCVSAADEGEDYAVPRDILDALTAHGLMEKCGRGKWRPTEKGEALAALSSPPGVQAAQVSDAELAWQNIETAEVEFLNNLAEKGGLADLLPGMLRHCARLVASRKRLLWALTEYPKRNPQQLQAAKVCAGVLKLAQPGSAAHGGEDAK